jgi:hypothetical protein
MPDRTDPKETGKVEGFLAEALSGPPADPVFRAHLRERILARAAASPARTRGARHAAGRNRGPGLRHPVTVLAVVAAAVLVFLVARPAFFPAPPAAALGMLPQPAVTPDSGQGGAAGGPGYTFEFSYSLSGGLAAGWPELPKQQLAYRMNPPLFTEQYVAQLAARLGISASVEREGWQDGYLLAADPGDGGPFIRMFPNGYTIYMRSYDFTPTVRADLPSDERAIEIARAWLDASGFAAKASLGATAVEEDTENGTLYVRFRPASPFPVVGNSPFAVVQIGRNELVVMGGVTWFTVNASSEYPLRGAAQAWEDVKDGKGLLEYQTREFPGPIGEDNVVRGQAAAERVQVAWALSVAQDGTPYLVPVYVFSGNVTVPAETGTVTLPFEVWAPAVTEEYVQR